MIRAIDYRPHHLFQPQIQIKILFYIMTMTILYIIVYIAAMLTLGGSLQDYLILNLKFLI
jgi:hypothetical protein